MDDGALAILVLGGICFLLVGFVKWLLSGPWTSGEAYPPPDSWVVYHRPTYIPPVVIEYHPLPPARIVRRSQWDEVVGNNRVRREETVEWAGPPQVDHVEEVELEWRDGSRYAAPKPYVTRHAHKLLPRPE
jgi:hypothetical protein